MKNFAAAVKGSDTLSAKEMKNVKGGGNCGFRPITESGEYGRSICGLEESQQSLFPEDKGEWCCKNCSSIGC